jgi:hypothetical protein
LAIRRCSRAVKLVRAVAQGYARETTGRSPLGRIDTTVTVKPGQFAVFGQSGFAPRGAMLTDPKPTLFYVVRAQPAT